MSTPFDVFKDMLLEAPGAALAERGFALQDDAIQMRSGLYRFGRPAQDDAPAFVDVQLLFYAGGGPSRFEVKVWRSNRPGDKTQLGAWLGAHGVETLADERGWWEFVSERELREALQDATTGILRLLDAKSAGN